MCTGDKKHNQKIWTFTKKIVKNLNEIEDFFFITFEFNNHKIVITNLPKDSVSLKQSFKDINYTTINKNLKKFFQKNNQNVLIRIDYSKICINRKEITVEDQEKILDEFENSKYDIKSKKITEIFKYFLNFLNCNEENITVDNSQLCITFFFDILLFGSIKCDFVHLDKTIEIIYPNYVNKKDFNKNNKKCKLMSVYNFREQEIVTEGKKLDFLLNCKERQILYAENYKSPNKTKGNDITTKALK